MSTFKSTSWDPDDLAVLCFIRCNNQLLLIHKLRGHGMGKINGPGGKCEPGELPIDTAIRETQEEVCLSPGDLQEAGTLRFHFSDGYQLEGRIFIADSFTGIPEKTEEADPFWCNIHSIPYAKMWEDDILWLPFVLNDYYIEATFQFTGDRMIYSNVVKLEGFSSHVLQRDYPEISKQFTYLEEIKSVLHRLRELYSRIFVLDGTQSTESLNELRKIAMSYRFWPFLNALNEFSPFDYNETDLHFLRLISVLKEQIYYHTVL